MVILKNIKSAHKHKRLGIFISALIVFGLGFLVYKYMYIYFERQKYEKLEHTISQIASSLRTYGIETISFKECSRAHVKYGKGSLSCSVGIIYEGNEIKRAVKEPLEIFISSIEQHGFSESSNRDELNPTRHPIIIGSLSYRSSGSDLGCSLSYDKVDDAVSPYTLRFSCGKYSRFVLFAET